MNRPENSTPYIRPLEVAQPLFFTQYPGRCEDRAAPAPPAGQLAGDRAAARAGGVRPARNGPRAAIRRYSRARDRSRGSPAACPRGGSTPCALVPARDRRDVGFQRQRTALRQRAEEPAPVPGVSGGRRRSVVHRQPVRLRRLRRSGTAGKQLLPNLPAGLRTNRSFAGGASFSAQVNYYHVDFSNRLLAVSTNPGGIAGGQIAGGTSILVNVGGVKTDGIDAAFTIRPGSGLTFYNATSYDISRSRATIRRPRGHRRRDGQLHRRAARHERSGADL
ncbi:hypothetical protein AB5I41_26305 [Sphingomonas sp. MMS24-JH45]